MSETNLGSVDIKGIGTYAGGDYDRVVISGKGTISSSMTCNGFSSSGTATIQGSLTSETFGSAGTCKVEGEISVQQMEISGSFKCLESVKIQTLESNGMFTVGKSFHGKNVTVNGTLNVEEDLAAEVVQLTGIMQVRGCVNVEECNLKLIGTSTVGEIGGSQISIEPKREYMGKIAKIFIPKKYCENKLIANSIEGDIITIESCEVDRIAGNKIVIGPNCKVNYVEYRDEIEIDETAIVGEYCKRV